MATPEGHGQLPFLRRNFARAVNAFSGAFGTPSRTHRDGHALPTDSGEHPRKRRRVATPEPAFDKLVASPRSSASEPMLRIEVLRCHHRNAKKVRHSFGSVVSPDFTTGASCRITISDVTLGRPRVLHCNSQVCNVVTFRDPAGSHRIARIELQRPFYIPRHSLLVQRLDEDIYDMSSAYRLSVELEATGEAGWPPLDLSDLVNGQESRLGSTPTRHWAFSASFDELFGRLKAPLTLTSNATAVEASCTTDYELHVDLQWTSGFVTLRRLEDGSKPCITAIDPAHWTPNGHGREGRGEATPHRNRESPDAVNGEHTPSRGLRTRGGDTNYNLKALSDRAHGRKRRQRKANLSISARYDGGRVTYLLPPDQPFSLDGYRCVNCGTFHDSLKHLQLHLRTSHPDYGYKLEMTDDGPQFLVTGVPELPATPSKCFSLGYPQQPLDLGSLVAGDDSWISSRLDPDTKGLFTTSPEVKSASRPPAPRSETRSEARSSPNRKKKIIIPETGHILYHPVSKQELKPGQEVPEPVVEKEWFHHRHNRGLNEVDDVTPAELEYMKEFDQVMREHDISARVYFPRAWLDFVQRKAGWIIGATHRTVEFALHESYLLASDLIGDEHVQEAVGYIEEERSRRRKMDKASPDGEHPTSEDPRRGSPEPTPMTPPVRKSAGGCGSCGLPVINGPRTRICSNPVRSKPPSLLFYSIRVPKSQTNMYEH